MGGRPGQPVVAVWLLTLAGGTALAAMTVMAPVLRTPAPRISALFYAVFTPLCHQVPDRCLHIAGGPFAVCARCFGIYLGFFLGALAYPAVRGFGRPRPPALWALLLATLPLAVDAGANLLGIWDSPAGLRLVTGLVWGAILPGYIIAGFSEAAAGLRPPGPRGSA
jgi:uncharacterized membrane protein